MSDKLIEVEKPISDEGTNYFDETYLHSYHSIYNQLTSEQIDFIKQRILSVFHQPKILDFGCGHGRHLLKLYEEGYDITGLDVNKDYLEIIRSQTGNNINLIHADGRFYTGNEEYDVVINMETSIGYLSDNGNRKLLSSIYNCLKPDGLFLLHVFNREAILRNWRPTRWFKSTTGAFILEKREADLPNGRLLIKQTRLLPTSTANEYIAKDCEVSIRLYTLYELKEMLTDTGFSLYEIYGDFDGRQYDMNTEEMIIVCKKNLR